MRKLLSALFLVLATALPAGAQVNPTSLPPNSVMGRLGIPTQGGPAQAIPFTVLTGSLLSSVTGAFTCNPSGICTLAPIADKSTIASSYLTFWNPYVNGPTIPPGLAATGKGWAFNRAFFGLAALSSFDLNLGPPAIPSTPSALDVLFQNGLVGNSQVAVGAAVGSLGITSWSDTLTYRNFSGVASQGSQAATNVGINSDTGTGFPIAVGDVALGVRLAGVGGSTLGFQADISNGGSVVQLTPYSVAVGGLSFAGGFTTGSYTNLATANPSAAWYVGQAGTPKFEKGGVFLSAALNSANGGGGNGIAFEFARNQSLRWLNSGLTTDAEIWGNATGLHGTQQIIPISNAAQGQAQNTTAFQVTLGAATETSVQALCPLAGTFRNLYLAVSPAPAAGQTVTATWRINGGDSTITCQATNGTPSCSDTTHTAACTPGQSYSLKTVTSATSGGISGIQAGIVFVP